MTSPRPLTESVDRLRRAIVHGSASVYPDTSMYRVDLVRVLDAVAPTRTTLTRRQAEVLAFIRDTIARRKSAPSYAEIAAHFGFRSLATVADHLASLEARGAIRREFNRPHGIELVEVAP